MRRNHVLDTARVAQGSVSGVLQDCGHQLGDAQVVITQAKPPFSQTGFNIGVSDSILIQYVCPAPPVFLNRSRDREKFVTKRIRPNNKAHGLRALPCRDRP